MTAKFSKKHIGTTPQERIAEFLSRVALDVWEKGERLERAGHSGIHLWNEAQEIFGLSEKFYILED